MSSGQTDIAASDDSTRREDSPICNAFTVDVEDYFQVTAFERDIPYDDWDGFESRVVDSTRRILGLLARHEVRGTFFVLGWVAARHPQLVREIHEAGHEIGSHSYRHRLIYRQTPEEFREDLRRSRDVLEDIVGEPVISYRAPSFSITNRSLWALEILVQEGFRVDSSIFPVRHDRYGIPGAEARIHQRRTPSGGLWEFPPTVSRHRLGNLPAGGGGYFRLYPLGVTRRLLRAINRGGRPFMFYIHPWEVDPRQPRLRAGSRISRIRHYLNLESTERKLDALLGSMRFAPISEVISAARDDDPITKGWAEP